MHNARTTSGLTRANRRTRGLPCRGRVSPRRLGLSKVVDVVSITNDALGTTVGAKKDGKYSAAVLSAFGEGTDADKAFFTGKPMVEGLGHAFLMRNYRAGLAKWQSADPMGYPDGWNQLTYCRNHCTHSVDFAGCNEMEDAINGILNHFKQRGEAGDIDSLKGESELTREMRKEYSSIGIENFRYKPMGFVDLWGEAIGEPWDVGAPYWEGGHLWQKTNQEHSVTMYKCELLCAIEKINTWQWWANTIAGATATVVGATGTYFGVAAVASGVGGVAVATTGLGALISSLFITTEVEIPLGFEFTYYYKHIDVKPGKRLIE